MSPIHGPSFRAGLQAAADHMAEAGFARSYAQEILRLKPPHVSTKASRARTEQRKMKASKLATKAAETATLWEQAWTRSGGFCECGCGIRLDREASAMFGTRPELDHFVSRGKVAQSLPGVWLLSSLCHRSKTRNAPSAAYWLEKWVRHCERHGYQTEAQRATARLDGIVQMRAQRPTPNPTHSTGNEAVNE